MLDKIKSLFNKDGLVTNEDILNRKRIYIGIAAIVVVLGIIAYSYFSYANKVKEFAKKNRVVRKDSIITDEDKRNSWKVYIESELEKIKKENEQLKKTVEEQKKVIETYKNQNTISDAKEMVKKEDAKQIEKEVLAKYKEKKEKEPEATKATKFNLNLLPPPPAPKNNNNKVAYTKKINANTNFDKRLTNNSANKKDVGIRVYKPAQEPATAKKEKPKKSIYIPSGSFFEGILLTGLDAPTMQAGTSNPQPVLININKDAILPNNYSTDIVDCFLLGSGRGDLSSERAYIRLVKLSCIDKDKQVIDTDIEGWIIGEDGKVGVRGRLVSKQGSVLAKALLAGFAEGVAKAFSSTASNISVTPEGSVTTIDPDKAFQVAGYTGVGEAMKRLADFYMKMAESMFPVIEVGAGRTVTVVIKDGKELILDKKKIVQTINYDIKEVE
ncbi:TraB/VirB10 family protein [Deferribacterales bacterium Es71-Z0220]|uniref:TraB/VirB10 family protein n=1 Tax=Deferrivibrio essentukiensis TaxID=2880922 RepID=UPI001F6113CC|nr:TraB/VirB10 family protein [Deferrivibrio essentukiensis]MCB4205592.1 TraB/VirB10 family protein [Deferrivibrio essentukiensis]